MSFMRFLKALLTTLIVGAIAVTLLSCSSDSSSAASPENQVVTVQRGNLRINITAVGNLELSRKEDLAFEMSSMVVQRVLVVEEVLVEEGESVEEGQELAKLDTSEWDDQVRTLERQLATKERDLTQKAIDVLNAEMALEDAEALYVWPAEILTARQAVRSAEIEVEDAQATLGGDKE